MTCDELHPLSPVGREAEGWPGGGEEGGGQNTWNKKKIINIKGFWQPGILTNRLNHKNKSFYMNFKLVIKAYNYYFYVLSSWSMTCFFISSGLTFWFERFLKAFYAGLGSRQIFQRLRLLTFSSIRSGSWFFSQAAPAPAPGIFLERLRLRLQGAKNTRLRPAPWQNILFPAN